MRIEITTTFNDMTRPRADRRVFAGAFLEVSPERAAELIELGIAREAPAPVEPVAAPITPVA